MMRRVVTLAVGMEGALHRALQMLKVRRERPSAKFPTFRGTGLQPGIDLDDSASLLDLMEGR